jgi:hypothetical protein
MSVSSRLNSGILLRDTVYSHWLCTKCIDKRWGPGGVGSAFRAIDIGFEIHCWFYCMPFPPRTALGPTQLPIQWIPGALYLRIKRPWREADHSPPSSAEVKEWVELHFHSPNTPSWRGVQLKEAEVLFPQPRGSVLCTSLRNAVIMPLQYKGTYSGLCYVLSVEHKRSN